MVLALDRAIRNHDAAALVQALRAEPGELILNLPDGESQLGRGICNHCSPAFLTMLIDGGADVNALNRRGLTPGALLVRQAAYPFVDHGRLAQLLASARVLGSTGASAGSISQSVLNSQTALMVHLAIECYNEDMAAALLYRHGWLWQRVAIFLQPNCQVRLAVPA